MPDEPALTVDCRHPSGISAVPVNTTARSPCIHRRALRYASTFIVKTLVGNIAQISKRYGLSLDTARVAP